MDKLKINGKILYLDPDTNFWAFGDEKEEKEVSRLYNQHKELLIEEMRRYRFEIDVKTAYINVTDICNANCPYCYIPSERRQKGRTMQRDELEERLNQLGEIGVEWVIFHGAEPLIAKDLIFEIIDDYDFNFGIQTNGFLLSEEDMDFIRKRNVNLGISFDSPHKNTEDFLRGRGHFEKICEILDCMSGYERLSVITTITKYNASHLNDVVDFLAGKVETVLMNIVRGTSENARAMRVMAANNFIEAVERAIQHTKNGNRVVIGDFANILLGIVAPTSRVLQCDITPCGAARRFLAVTTDGYYPCSEFIGLREFKSKDLDLNCKEFETVRRRIVEKIEECKTCLFRNICGSPCPAEVYSESGSLYSKSPSCEFYRAIIEHAFRVVARGDEKYVLKMENLKKIFAVCEDQI
jgi:uncharacterized protein